MESADLLLAYDWPYDEPFLARLGRSLRAAGPEISPVPNGQLSYQCGPEELVFDWMGAYGAVPMIFKRRMS
jgi:hypothetical protein